MMRQQLMTTNICKYNKYIRICAHMQLYIYQYKNSLSDYNKALKTDLGQTTLNI